MSPVTARASGTRERGRGGSAEPGEGKAARERGAWCGRGGAPTVPKNASRAGHFCYNSPCLRVGTWRSLVARLLWEQDVAGSNPVVPTSRGCGSMVELKPSKLLTRVRFPSPAPLKPQVRALSALTILFVGQAAGQMRVKSERNFRPCCFERCIPGPACSAAHQPLIARAILQKRSRVDHTS